ncbi:MAG TPA: organic hydroperoxide resistance protein [Bryobacteraceae bacterium]|nr:organic hydroperoxide resistance protein [Bryobacteraceae bacterium]
MITLEKVLYTAKAHTTGGRDGGSSRTDDGRLDVELSEPGKPGNGTNPEQLLAVGWSACFLSAIKLLAGKKKVMLPNDAAVDAEIDLGQAQGGYHLAARLNVALPGLDQQTAQSLVEGASHICPYSIALKGNIPATYNLVASDPSASVGQLQHA